MKFIKNTAQLTLLALSASCLITLSAAAEQNDMKAEKSSQPTANDKDMTRASLVDYFVYEGEQSRLLRDANQTFLRVREQENNASLKSLLPKAKCVAVFPRVTKAAVLIGGSHGDGVASCRTEDGNWSQVSFLDLYKMSFGTELGVKGTELVMLFMSESAEEELKSGQISFGANMTGVAGSSDVGLSESTIEDDVALYSSSGGLFAGIGLDGTYLKVDTSELEDFYKEPVTQVSVLTTYNKKGKVEEVDALIRTIEQ